MTRSAPPALAIRLMSESMTDPSVIGDLVEEYGKGRSKWWFWKQAIAASAPPPLNILRWAVAIPLAFATARLVQTTFGMDWDVHRLLVAALSPACLILTAAWIVPSRRLLVAKTLLAIVGIPCTAFIGYFGYRSTHAGPGSEMSALLAAIAVSTLLGAVAGYAVAYYFFRPSTNRGRLAMD